jgi:hypothetical protein
MINVSWLEAHTSWNSFYNQSKATHFTLKIGGLWLVSPSLFLGGDNAKKRAVFAVARKLSVLLHKLWVSGLNSPVRTN